MADNKRIGVKVDVEFEAGKKSADSLSRALDKIKKDNGSLDIDLKFDKQQDNAIRDFARKTGANFNKEFANSIKNNFNLGDLDRILADTFNSVLSKINTQMSKQATESAMKQYQGFINELKGKKFSINNIALDKNELNKLKSDIRGTLSIDKNAIGIDSLMQEIKDLGRQWGFAFDSDVIQDNVIQLGKIIAEYKNIKKSGLSAGLNGNEEEELMAHISQSYIDMIEKLEQLEKAKEIVKNEGINGLKEENQLIKEQLELIDGRTLEKGKTLVDGNVISEYEKIEDTLGNIHTITKNLNGDTEKIVEPLAKLEDAERKLEESIYRQNDALDVKKSKLKSILDDLYKNDIVSKDMLSGLDDGIDNINLGTSDTELAKIANELNNLKSLEKQITNEKKLQQNEMKKLFSEQEDLNVSMTAYKKVMESTLNGLKSKYSEVINSMKGEGLREQIGTVEQMVKNLNPQSMKDFANQTKIINAETRDLKTNILNVGREWSTAQKNGNTFLGAISDAMKKVGIFSLAYDGINKIQNEFREGIQSVIEMDTALSNLQKVVSLTDSQLLKMRDSAVSMGEALGRSAVDVANAQAEFGRMYKDLDTINKMTEASIIGANVMDGTNADEVAKGLTTIISSLKLEAEDAMMILDSMNEVQNNYRISAQDMMDALAKVGSTASVAGADLQQLEGYVTALSVATGKSGDEIGESLKSLTSRIYKIGSEGLSDSPLVA